MSRMVVARLAGPAPAWTRAGDHVEVERPRVHLPDVGEDGVEAEVGGDRRLERVDVGGEPRRSSMSCCVPTGPFMPRSG